MVKFKYGNRVMEEISKEIKRKKESEEMENVGKDESIEKIEEWNLEGVQLGEVEMESVVVDEGDNLVDDTYMSGIGDIIEDSYGDGDIEDEGEIEHGLIGADDEEEIKKEEAYILDTLDEVDDISELGIVLEVQESEVGCKEEDIEEKELVDEGMEEVRKNRGDEKLEVKQEGEKDGVGREIQNNHKEEKDSTNEMDRLSSAIDRNICINSSFERYEQMDAEHLYKEVRKFMIDHNVKEKPVEKQLLDSVFGSTNLKVLYRKGYLISLGKVVTMGR